MFRFPQFDPAGAPRPARLVPILATALALLPAVAAAAPEDDFVLFDVKIDDAALGGSVLVSGDEFGIGIARLGDLDDNGVDDVAIGARKDHNGGGTGDRGSVYVLFLDEDGQILNQALIASAPEGDPFNVFGGIGTHEFGQSIAWLGDYDGDTNFEIAIGVAKQNAPGTDSGQIWIVDIDSSARPLDYFTIDGTSANFTSIDAGDLFGYQIENLDDWDGDGAPEIAVTALYDDDGGTNNGAVYILYLDPDPMADAIKGFAKLSATQGGFDGGFDSPTIFGSGLANLGDLDGDGQNDLAIGAADRGANGSVYIVFMDPACASGPGSCVARPGAVEITEGSGGLQANLQGGARFGFGAARLEAGPLQSEDQLVVGNYLTNLGASDAGSVWILTLGTDGTVQSERQIAPGLGTDAAIGTGDNFGVAVDSLGDMNGDGITDLLVGAFDDGPGAAYLMTVNPCISRITNPIAYHAPDDDGVRYCPAPSPATYPTTLHLYVDSGQVASAVPADVCQDELGEGDELCAFELTVTLTGGYTIDAYTPASLAPSALGLPGITGERHNAPQPGSQELKIAWVAPGPGPAPLGPIKVGDLEVAWDGTDATAELGTSSAGLDAGLRLQKIPATDVITLPEPVAALGLAAGAALVGWLARRRRLAAALLCALAFGAVPSGPAAAATAVKDFVILRETGVLNWPAGVQDRVGSSVALIGDYGGPGGGDGVLDFAFGAPLDGTCSGTESVYLVFTDSQGLPLGYEGPISESGTAEEFGRALEPIDLDLDGRNELAIGASGCGDGSASSYGEVVLVTLDDAGREASRTNVDNADLGGVLDLDDYFGYSLESLGDIDGDPSNVEIAVGAIYDDDGGTNAGAIYILSLASDGSVDWSQKVGPGAGGFAGAVDPGDGFGWSLAMLGDLDGAGPADFAIAVGANRDDDGGTNRGAVWVLFLESTAPGSVSVISESKISATSGGFTEAGGALSNESRWGEALAFRPVPDAEGRGVLYASYCKSCFTNPAGSMHVMYLDQDGSVQSTYEFNENSGHGFIDDGSVGLNVFGSDIEVIDDFDGDQAADLLVGARGSNVSQGAVLLMFLQDSDFDGLDDELDNCPFEHNPRQTDADGDGVGDLCDNCPALFNDTQDDFDSDGEGDVCEPVEVQLQFQDTASTSAPVWDLSLQCGAFDVTEAHVAIVLPAGALADTSCPGPPYPKGCLTLSGASIGAGSGSSGPGLVSPSGVRDDAVYFSAFGNGLPDDRLCTALDPPVLLGTLSTGAISGTQLAASALTEEGVGAPGFGLSLAVQDGVPIPETAVRLVNGPPGPILDLELGPAVETASGTKWEVRVVRANDEFHRVAFGLIAPAGTTSANMRWLGCDTTPDVNGARDCCESPPCGDFDGLGVGTNVNPNRSFTVGPQSSPPGTQVPHTMYVVLEGSALSNGALDTVNPAAEGQFHVLGEIELTGSPDLEPALTVDGANDIDDLFSAGKVVPLVDVSSTTRLLDEVKLIGAFNPADDVDGDGIQDLGDNCPFEPNPAQTNRGAFLDPTEESNPLGDACECGEATDDGAVIDPDDYDEIFDYLAGKITNPVIAAEIEARCSVAGTTECNVRDLVFLQQAIAAGDPSVATRCDAALSPPPGP